LDGPSHDKGGIQAVVTDDNDRPVELEGDEVIINKKSMSDKTVYTVKGTPRQIASAINSMKGNGVVIEGGAELTNHSTGEVKIMKKGGSIPPFNYLWFLTW
jgi:hypothetical protein